MYNTKVICTYHSPEVFLDSDIVNENEKDFIRDAVYRQELLDILIMEDFDIEIMDKSINKLYEKLEKCEELVECMLKASSSFMCSDKVFGLIILYSFDYMYLTHICVSEYLETGKIDKINIENLKNNINLKLNI